MKSNGLVSVLTGAVMISALTTAWVSLRYFFSMRDLQKLQVQYVNMNNVRSAAQSLANEALEYSKSNSAIDPILYQFDIKARPGTNRASTAPMPRVPEAR